MRQDPLAEHSLPPPEEFGQTQADLEQWSGGDKAAGDRLFLRYQRSLTLLIARQIHSIQNPAVRARLCAEDLFQDAAGTMLRKMDDFEYRGPGSLYGWMRAIVIHTVTDAIDHWRAAKRQAGREQALEAGAAATGENGDACHGPAWHGAGPSTMAHQRELGDHLLRAIAALDERPHRIVTLRYFFGAGWAEIAREVGSPSADAVRKEMANVLVSLGAGLKAP